MEAQRAGISGKPVTTITLEDGTVKDVVSYLGDRRATYRTTNNRLSLHNNDDNSDDEEDDDVVEVSPPVNVAIKNKRSNKLYPDGVPKRRVVIPDRAWGIGPQSMHRPVSHHDIDIHGIYGVSNAGIICNQWCISE